ncbi:murein biosynthesis integral membrane protein MurJ [Allosphingosinicella sp.]|jgi:putative peptidoglycan lipid II flippase|uniref:murein biosynthesis integral membrane protein MurJ n=1 Tax=Allosphingosinicella sp. TaxID=2823234 RepID=UPI002EED0868
MNLMKAIGTIGGLTMVSRVLGFARDMIGSRVLGASHQNDAFLIAFLIPNIFRRLFGEGAFASGFVPLFSQRLNSEGGMVDAQKFSNEVLSVFMPALILVTLVFEVIMPGFVWLMASRYQDVPGKFDLTVALTRITFPYLIFISLVSLLSGVLNSLMRFAIAAFAPALLNLALIVALILKPGGGSETVTYMALAVLAGGLLQLALCWYSVRKAGIRLRLFQRPRMSPGVKQLVILVLPATFAAGVYQISQFFYGFFASRLGEGAMAYLNYADRLNQLPLSIIGTALGTAILPSISRAIDRNNSGEAARIQGRAFELSMLLTLPATLALAVASGPIIGALFQGGEFTVEDAAITGNVLAILVIGLPGYVLVKVLTPGFYARKDVRTPVRIAMAVLIGSVAANFALIPFLGIYSLATVTAAGAWINFLLLFVILRRRGHFAISGEVARRLVRQLFAAVAMAAVLFLMQRLLGGLFLGSAGERMVGVGALVGSGVAVYFTIAWVIGGMNREDLHELVRRKRAE